MPCGRFITTDIPDNQIGGAEQEAQLDTPDKMTKEQQPDGTWTLTLTFPPCSDGSDPIQKKISSDTHSTIIGRASTSPAAFIQSHLAAARAVKEKYQIPISVCLAQSALETGWGRSVVGNAYFGIKAGAGHKSVTTTTHEVRGGNVVQETADFRSYASFEEAADDYGSFLTTNNRYRPAFAHTDNPEAFAIAVANAGYATDPNYGTKLVQIMRTNNLEDFDRV
jgi:flagellar protein FlgJ